MNPQRYLALAGLGSRRTCEALIREGRATINGDRLNFGVKISEHDEVRVDGKPIGSQAAPVYLMLHKQAGFVSDRGDPDSPSALDLPGLPKGIHAVGRLDKDATGLLLLTNDGELSYLLAHPSFEHEKEYEVWVEGFPNEHALNTWRSGMTLYGSTGMAEQTAPAFVNSIRRKGSATLLRVILHEGKKRQIKRVAKAIGHPVQALRRVRIGPLHLDASLRPGQWRALRDEEVAGLKTYATHAKI